MSESMNGSTVSESPPACKLCGDEGKVTYDFPGGGFGTRPCECVRDLPAIYGKATWWDKEIIQRSVIPVPVFDESVSVAVDCEVPLNDGGRRLHRTESNSYYPPLIEFEASCERLTLLPYDARKLAAALIAAADACDAVRAKTDELTRLEPAPANT